MRFYDRIYEVYEGFWAGPAQTYSTFKLKTALADLVKSELRAHHKRSMVLDVGCGIGTDLNMLSVEGIRGEFLGTDISSDAIRKAHELMNKRNKPNFHWIVADAELLPIKDCCIGIVISSEVIEHLEYPLKFLFEVKRILNIGGVTVITTPNPDIFIEKILKYLKKYAPTRISNLNKEQQWHFKRIRPDLSSSKWETSHISIMNFDKLKKLVEKAELRIEEIRGSAIFGGHAWFDKHCLILGVMIVIDSFVSKLVRFSKHIYCNMVIKIRKVK